MAREALASRKSNFTPGSCGARSPPQCWPEAAIYTFSSAPAGDSFMELGSAVVSAGLNE